MGPIELLARVRGGNVQNVSFRDLCHLVEALGFRLDRVQGSHFIYVHPVLHRSYPLQPHGPQAKAYQLRELIRLVERYNLRLEGPDE